MANPSPQPQKQEALDTLLEKADLQGYLTTGDIMEVFPWDGEDDDRLLELFGLLHRQGIAGAAWVDAGLFLCRQWVRERYGFLCLQPDRS